jgi:Secretion system C-terminal sorting domain
MKIKLFVLFIFILFALNLQAQSYPLKIAILGNSITNNGPNPALGWSGNWGMAASAKDKDYVRLLEKELKSISKDIEIRELNIASFERDFQGYNPDNLFINGIRDFRPDILIIRLGDNVDERVLGLDFTEFNKALQNVVKQVANGRFMKVIVSNSFWSSAVRDAAFFQFAVKYGHRFVNLNGLYDDKSNTAFGLFANFSVADHPSDKGMQGIKDRIWKELYQDVDYFLCNNYKVCDYCQDGDYTGFLDQATCDTISGWVFDQGDLNRLTEVEISVDDKPYINLLANLDRSDLQKAFGVNALKHGFKYAIPAGVTWRDGKNHIIKAKPCYKTAKPLLQSGKVINCPKTDPQKEYIPDYVSGWASTECNEIIGWAYDKNDLTKIVKIDVLLNDKLLKMYDANQSKPELLALLSNTPDAVKHTFTITLPTLPKGNSTIQMRITETGKNVGNANIFECPKPVILVPLSTLQNEEDSILIYPNPNKGEFHIFLPKNLKSADVQLFDFSGLEYNLINKGGIYLINSLAQGVYFLRVSKDERIIVRKIVVE